MNRNVLDDLAAHLPALREQLNSRLLELQAEVSAAQDLDPVRESAGSGEVTDRKDHAGLLQLSEVSEAEEQRDREEVRQIDRALQRMESASYGTCEQCGSPIPLQRLLVQPAADRCLGCQEALETKHRLRPAG